MKKYNLLAVLLISTFIFSCNKNDETTLPDNASRQAQQQNLSDARGILSKENLPEFNEKNSKALNWNQLPAELRNATRLDNSKEPTKTGETPTSNAVVFLYTQGPWGGPGGTPYSIYPTQANSRICAIGVQSNAGVVTGIDIWYKNASGKTYLKSTAGVLTAPIFLSTINVGETIRGISGKSSLVLNHLTITTNLKALSYGGTAGTPFAFSLMNPFQQILGFFGGASFQIDRLGVYVYSK
jgi:hypothetical protein